jgi:DMSO reductase anchor subunit
VLKGLIILISMSFVTIAVSAFLCVYAFHLPPTVAQIICGAIGMLCGVVCLRYCFYGDQL